MSFRDNNDHGNNNDDHDHNDNEDDDHGNDSDDDDDPYILKANNLAEFTFQPQKIGGKSA